MKVKLKNNAIVNGMTKNRIYEVISVSGKTLSENMAVTVFDDLYYRPIRVENLYLEVVNNRIEAGWVMTIDNHAVRLIHEKLSYSTFWEEFYEGDTKAVKLFQEIYPEYKELR